MVDEIEIDECPILIEKDVITEHFASGYNDPIWEEFMSRTYDDYSDGFSSYFDFSKSLEHVRFIKNFLKFNESKIYLHIMIVIQIRRYVHLCAFSPH